MMRLHICYITKDDFFPAFHSAFSTAMTESDIQGVPEVLDVVRVDKKRVGDKVRFIAIRDVGRCEPAEVAITELSRILRPAPRA